MECCLSNLKIPKPANLTIGIMYKSDGDLSKTINALILKYGGIDFKSEPFNFSEISEYYDPEMGSGIKKIIISFRNLIQRELIKDVKLFSIMLEQKFTKGGNRFVNIDPGLVSLENFILTTGKNFSHRVYLEDGVFAEVTLSFSKNDINIFPWTYKDYQMKPARSALIKIRENYKDKLKYLV